MGIPFIKLQDVIETFNNLMNDINEEVEEFTSYIEVTYIPG